MQLARDVELDVGGGSDNRDTVSATARGFSSSVPGRVSGSSSFRKDPVTANSLGFSKPVPPWASAMSSPTLTPSASSHGSSRLTSSPSSHPVSSTASSALRRPENDRHSFGDKSRSVNHISYSELMYRKAKGLCFRCSEKFHPLHQCSHQSLRMMILADDESPDDSSNLLAIEAYEGMGADNLECNAMGLFGMAPSNPSKSRTMRLSGSIGGVPLVVLIDNGASHNFLSPHVEAALGLPFNIASQFSVRLGDGHCIHTKGKCSNIALQLGDLELTIDAYILDFGGVDLILGVAWLQTLGKVLMDWADMSMIFEMQGAIVKLQSIRSQGSVFIDEQEVTLHKASLFSVMKDSHQFLDGILWSMTVHADSISELSGVRQGALQRLITQCQFVFGDAVGLPPHRGIDHAISLLPRTPPISVRPYLYPHHQKNEIERQVRDMLA